MCYETKVSHARREYARGVNDGATLVEQRAARFTSIATNGVQTRDGRVYVAPDVAAVACERAMTDRKLPKGSSKTFKPRARDGKSKDPALLLGATTDLDRTVARIQVKCQGETRHKQASILRHEARKRGMLPTKPVKSSKANQRSRAATSHFATLVASR